MNIETLAVHAGHEVDPATGAVAAPIYLSTTFERAVDGTYPHGHMYSRESNPNRMALEHALALLEGGVGAAAFSSGSAATMSVFQALAPGDHVVAPADVYSGTPKLLREVFARWGLQTTFVDMTNLAAVEAALQPATRLIWLETPSNPLLKICDIAAVASMAHEAGALLACDNTWATPILQRPLDLGADLVVHSTTKYISGHSDVLGGTVITREDHPVWQRIAAVQIAGGAVPSPFECWLALRGIQTLPLRVQAQAAHALEIARALSEHRAVEVVHYPGLPDHPDHQLAAAQMRQFGGMLSIQVGSNQGEAMAFVGRLKLWTRATSLGGVESLIEHRASIEGPGTHTPLNLLRLSVGLEHPADLIADLLQALEARG